VFDYNKTYFRSSSLIKYFYKMRNNFLFLFTIALFVFVSCNKEENDSINGNLEPVQVQRALVVETTGIWCSACPYGAELLKKIDYDYGDQVLPIALHSGDALSNATSQAMESNFPTNGVPNFYVGNTDAGQSPNGVIEASINSNPVAGVGHEWTKEGSSYNITSRIKFYGSDNGEFYVGCYFIQDPIEACGSSLNQTAVAINNQGCSFWDQDAVTIGAYEDPPGSQNWMWEYLISEGTTYTHDYVIAGHGGNNIWGDPLGISSVSAGQEYNFNFSINEGFGWNQSGHILTVLWKKSGNSYEFINGYSK